MGKEHDAYVQFLIQHLGDLYLAEGHYDRLATRLEEIVHLENGQVYMYLSIAFARRGDLEQGRHYADRAFTLATPGTEDQARCLNNLAGIAALTHEYGQALKYLHEAQKVIETLYADSHPMVQSGRANIRDLEKRMEL